MRRSRSALIVVLVALAAGCETVPALPPVPVVTDLVFVTQSEPQSAYMDALYMGRIHVDGARCTRLDNDHGATVIWPRGFSVRQDGEAIMVVDGAGHDVRSSGGVVLDFRR